MTVTVINWAGVDDNPTDHVLTVAGNPGLDTDHAQGGISMSEAFELYCSASYPGTFDTFNDGIAVSPLGAMRVIMCATIDGPPADAVFCHGLPVTPVGQLCLTSDGTIENYVSGWPVDVGGLVIVGASVDALVFLLMDGDDFLLMDGDNLELS